MTRECPAQTGSASAREEAASSGTSDPLRWPISAPAAPVQITSTLMRRSLILSCVALSLAPLASAGDLVIFYDPSQGALPTERCWDAVGPQNAPPPTIVDGALVHGLTGYGNTSYFSHPFPPISFDDGAAIEAAIKVDSSTWYSSNPYKRTGILASSTALVAGRGSASRATGFCSRPAIRTSAIRPTSSTRRAASIPIDSSSTATRRRCSLTAWRC